MFMHLLTPLLAKTLKTTGFHVWTAPVGQGGLAGILAAGTGAVMCPAC